MTSGLVMLTASPAVAETVLMDCDEVAGKAKFGPALTPDLGVSALKLVAPTSGPGSRSHCTADPGTPWEAVAAAGTRSVKAKLGVGFTDSTRTTPNGGVNCGSQNPTYQLNGKLTISYDLTDGAGRAYASTAYVRMSDWYSPVELPPGWWTVRDAVTVTGIVTKGVGVGADVSTELLVQPTAGRHWDSITNTAATDLSDPISAVNGVSGIAPGSDGGGRLAAGATSAALSFACQLWHGSGSEITGAVLGTDGMSLNAFLVDPALNGALGNVQSSCDADWKWSGSTDCLNAQSNFATAYTTAYASGDYDLDSSLRFTTP